MLDFGSFSLIRKDSREVRETARHPKEVEGRGRDREARRGGVQVWIRRAIWNQTGDYSLYQYRDIDKREIDFIVEDADGNLAGIEVKAGSGVGKNDFKHLAWFREHPAKGRKFVGIVLYAGSETLSFGNGMQAVPISVLWS